MTYKMFDVQAALLYARAKTVDFAELTTAIHKRAAWTGVACELELLEGLTGAHILTLGGGGLHVTVSLRADPCDSAAFSMALKSPIRKMKSFDFEGTIASHEAAIVVNVGDGDTPMPVEAREMMADMAGMAGTDPIQKLMILQLVMQTLIELIPPLMVDFCPSQSLLSPVEFEAVKDMALPVPILFHPLLEVGGASQKDKPLLRMTALHSQLLVDKLLVLDGADANMNPGLMINIIATLIIEHRAGNLPFEHDDVVQLDDDLAVQFIDDGSDDDAPMGRILIRLVNPAGPFEAHPAPEHAVPPIEQTAAALDATIDNMMKDSLPAAGSATAGSNRARSAYLPRMTLTIPAILLAVAGYAAITQNLGETIRASLSAQIAAVNVTEPAPVNRVIQQDRPRASSAMPNATTVAPQVLTPSAQPQTGIVETNGLLSRMIKSDTDS